MIIKCSVQQCGYNKNGCCDRIVLHIQENGTCGWMYNRNEIRIGFNEKQPERWEDE